VLGYTQPKKHLSSVRLPQCVTLMFVKRSKQIIQVKSLILTALPLSSFCLFTNSWRSFSNIFCSAVGASLSSSSPPSLSSSSSSRERSMCWELLPWRGLFAPGESSKVMAEVACERFRLDGAAAGRGIVVGGEVLVESSTVGGVTDRLEGPGCGTLIGRARPAPASLRGCW